MPLGTRGRTALFTRRRPAGPHSSKEDENRSSETMDGESCRRWFWRRSGRGSDKNAVLEPVIYGGSRETDQKRVIVEILVVGICNDGGKRRVTVT